MRRIDLSKLKADAAWDVKAKIAQQSIDSGLKNPKSLSHIWSAAKDRLKDLSSGKCWYCEAREDRSDNAVDHFRPKSIYPWFACDLRNFRYACTFCNSVRKNPERDQNSGKGDHFPLFGGSIATNHQERNSEDYVLIDPCVTKDVGLLDFTDDGRPRAKYPNQKIRNKRAEDSIKYYHLDHPDLNEARRQLALQIAEWIEGADAIYGDNDQMDAKKEKAFASFVESIARTIDKSSPFSVFAKKMIKGYQDRPWIEDLLDCA